jgi:iron complex transport system ATP-binding protein
MKFSIENLALSHGDQRVIDGVEAVLEPGRVTVVLGGAGAGKALLLRALAGRVDLDAGQIRLGGRLIGRFTKGERAAAFMLLGEGRRGLFGRGPVDLADAIGARPSWLCAADPLSMLDPVTQFARIGQLRAAAQQGMGVVVTLADPVLAARLADDVLLLGQGRMLGFGPAREVLEHRNLRQAFGIEVMVIGDANGRLLPVPIGFATQ